MVEKVYVKVYGDYVLILGGFLGEGLEDFIGGVIIELFMFDILDIDDFWNNEMFKVN